MIYIFLRALTSSSQFQSDYNVFDTIENSKDDSTISGLSRNRKKTVRDIVLEETISTPKISKPISKSTASKTLKQVSFK